MRSRRRRRLLLITFVAFALIGCALVSLFVASLSNSVRSPAAHAAGNRIVYGLTLVPRGFDPHINESSELGIVFRSVYDTLIYRDPQTKQIVPGLAERWSISADGLTYTFTLKTGVKFHDGTPFDAYAVATTLDRITDPATKSTKALFLLGPYAGRNVVDAQTIQVVLKTPYAPLLDSFCQVYLGIASPKALKEYDAARYQFHQVGSGPYQMVEYVPGDRLVLRRNPDYTWGPKFYNAPGPNSVDEIVFKFFEDPSTRAPALETGAAQVMGELAPTDARLFSSAGGVRLVPQPIPGQPLQFFFNTARAPTDRVDMRRALLSATNRVAIVDSVFQQFSPVAYGPLSAVTPFYEAKVQSLYPFDQNAARDALLRAGYADSDNDKILDKDGQKLHLVMVTPPWGLIPQVAQKIQSQWRELGIELDLKPVPNLAGLEAAVQAGDYNLVAFNDSGLDASILDRFFLKDARFNFSKHVSGNMENWLSRATQSQSAEERRTMYSAAQSYIMDQALILPIRDYVNLNGAAANLGGLTFDAYGWFPLLANLTLTKP